MRKPPVILNSAGEPIVLNEREKNHARWVAKQLADRFENERDAFGNALGYEVATTTLTTIMKKVTEQKFFEISPADYLPVRVGEGAFSSNLLTYRSYALGDAFETGIINLGSNDGRMASGDAGVDSLTVKVLNWGKKISWNIFDLEMAAKVGNWDLVTAKEKQRKKNWDLGIQKIAFLGASGDTSCLGLYTQSGITTDLTTIPQAISTLGTVDLKAFCTAILNAYRANCNRTAWPTHFIIPESDYLGLGAPASSDFPIKSTLQVLEETFQVLTRNKNFKILPCAYGDLAYSGQTYQQYVLLNYDEESIRMDIPVDYTNTLANSLDNFNFQNVGYGQFTGVLAYRPLELMYFRFTP